VFQKSYTGNILGIGRNKSRTSQYLKTLPEDQRGDGEGLGARLTTRGRGVTTRKIPLLDNCLLFSFFHHLDIMHHHASFTLHVFVKTEIILINSILFRLIGFIINPPLLSYLN
jgi:hypothetical protein